MIIREDRLFNSFILLFVVVVYLEKSLMIKSSLFSIFLKALNSFILVSRCRYSQPYMLLINYIFINYYNNLKKNDSSF